MVLNVLEIPELNSGAETLWIDFSCLVTLNANALPNSGELSDCMQSSAESDERAALTGEVGSVGTEENEDVAGVETCEVDRVRGCEIGCFLY